MCESLSIKCLGYSDIPTIILVIYVHLHSVQRPAL